MNEKLGYYTVADKLFYSKVAACVHATKILQKMDPNLEYSPEKLIKWHFNNEVFSAYDWTKEPELTLDELYDKRARELREKYDYIIISYSGGSDSHNVIMSFLRQGLFIDEIVITQMHEAMKNFAIVDINNSSSKYCFESEFKLQALPRLKEILTLSPKTKITELDTSQSVFDFFSKEKDESWVFKVKEELNPIDAARYDLCKFAIFERKIDTSKKVGIILGVCKPRIRIQQDTNRVEIVFSDRVTNQVPISEFLKKYDNTTIEFFYWSPDACDLLCKQAHVKKRWLEKNTMYQPFFLNNSYLLKNNRFATDRIFRSIIYTTWNKDWFQADKNQLDWNAEHDYWFINGAKNTIEHSLWRSGLKFVEQNCKPYISYYLDDPNLFADGLIRFKNCYKIGYLNNINNSDNEIVKDSKNSFDNIYNNVSIGGGLLQRKVIDITEKDLENIIYMNNLKI